MFLQGVQALTNYKNQSTGQLSATTLMMQFGGCVARVFTSVQETGDTLLILTYVAATVLNGIILCQLFYYANLKEDKKRDGKTKKKSQ